MIVKSLNTILARLGWRLEKLPVRHYPDDFEELHRTICDKSAPYTMTSPERVYGLIEAIRYVNKFKIEGSIVECGVWKGGSMLATAETLLHLGDTTRELFLYDTFEGMPPPDDIDKTVHDRGASKLLEQDRDKASSLIWAYSTLQEVKSTLNRSNYPTDKIKYVVGKVEDTIPSTLPRTIALLRLDTDWYASTKHELHHLFPLITKGGILIIDDYGFWKGARKAVDEYFAETGIQIHLCRMDDTGRIGIKS